MSPYKFLFVAISLAACTTEPAVDNVDNAGDDLPINEQEQPFSARRIADGTAPAVAVDGNGVRSFVYVDGATKQAMWAPETGTAMALPDDGSAAHAVAVITDNNGSTHVVWDAGGAIWYLNKRDGEMGEGVVVAQGPAAEPNVALADDGTLAISWTEMADEPTVEPPRLYVVRSEENGFGAAVHVNPGCCMSELMGDYGYEMSGAHMDFAPDGRLHLVYEWMGSFDTVVEYQNESEAGVWNAPVRIAIAAYAPCPAVVADNTGAHVSFLLESPQDVLYSRIEDGVVSDPVSMYHLDWEQGSLRMALLLDDAEGDLHLAVTRWTPAGQDLVYMPVGEPNVLTVIATVADTGAIDLTPRSGGAMVAPDGQFVFAWTRREAEGKLSAEAAWGHRP